VVARVLVASLALHLAVGVALARLRTRAPGEPRGSIEVTVAPSLLPLRAVERAAPPPSRSERIRDQRVRIASSAASRSSAAPRLAPQSSVLSPHARPLHASPSSEPSPSKSQSSEPSSNAPQSSASSPPPVNLFAASALAKAADIAIAATAADRAWRPRHGVGGDGAAGGVDVGSFLAEDAARLCVQKGAVAPALRAAERSLDQGFAPSFTQADISNRAELFLKQFRGFLRDPPKTGELQRGLDPTKETLEEKMRSRHLDQAFFLGRRVEVFVRQRADGSIVEMALRNPSGYRGFDDVALAAVERALGGRAPAAAAAAGGEVRTLWQLDATAYVVISPDPELVFDESTGKREWIHPQQKRVDHHVRLLAVY
jgi:hypothetical protein